MKNWLKELVKSGEKTSEKAAVLVMCKRFETCESGEDLEQDLDVHPVTKK